MNVFDRLDRPKLKQKKEKTCQSQNRFGIQLDIFGKEYDYCICIDCVIEREGISSLPKTNTRKLT